MRPLSVPTLLLACAVALLAPPAASAQQAGWTCRFASPPQGTTYVLRGVTELAWRARDDRRDGRWEVVRRRTLLSATGMDGVQGGSPWVHPKRCA